MKILLISMILLGLLQAENILIDQATLDANEYSSYSIPVASNSTVAVNLNLSNSDFDLFLRWDEKADFDTEGNYLYDCGSFSAGIGNEKCILNNTTDETRNLYIEVSAFENGNFELTYDESIYSGSKGDDTNPFLEDDLAIEIPDMFSGKTYHIDGYFIHFADGVYNWVYIGSNLSVVAKLEGMNDNGTLKWSLLHSEKSQVFEYITVYLDQGKIEFGPLKYNIIGVEKILAANSFDIKGNFSHYDTGLYDWIYLSLDGSLVAKLEGMQVNGNLDWTILQMKYKDTFETIKVNNRQRLVTFGNLIPGLTE